MKCIIISHNQKYNFYSLKFATWETTFVFSKVNTCKSLSVFSKENNIHTCTWGYIDLQVCTSNHTSIKHTLYGMINDNSNRNERI